MAPKKTKEQFILDARKIHGNEYCYDNVVYDGNKVKVLITHIKCGFEFPQTPDVHLRGSGCSKCGYVKSSKTQSKTKEQFILDAQKVHGLEYDYSQVDYKNNYTHIILKHIKCGFEFSQTPDCHINGNQGCPKCGGTFLKTTEQFILDAINVHGLEYDYSQVDYKNNSTHIILKHIKCGFEFPQSPNRHLMGDGCPKCSHAGYSKICIKWLETIMKNNNIFIQHAENIGEYRIPNTKYKADGYCVENNTVYEFNGCAFHGCCECQDMNGCSHPYSTLTNLELYVATRTREHLLRDLGYNLVVRWECDE